MALCGGGATANTGRMFIMLKPLEERKVSADQVIDRLRGKLAHVPGATLYLAIRPGPANRRSQSNAQYQYTLQCRDPGRILNKWAPKLLRQDAPAAAI